MSNGTPLDKLYSFRRLSRGWHYGEGGPIEDAIINRAKEVFEFFQEVGFPKHNFFAACDRGVLVTAYNGDLYIGIFVDPCGSYSIEHAVCEDDRFYCEGLSLADVKKKTIDAISVS